MRPRPLPPLLRHQCFRVSDAVPEVGRERLRRTDLVTPTYGVRADRRSQGAHPTPDDLVVVLSSNQYFSHVTAASLWGLPVPRSPLVHVTTIGTGSVTRRAGVVGHRVSRHREALDMVRGLPVSDRLTTWADCATMLDLDDLIRLGDALLSKAWEHELLELEAAVDARKGARGVALLREALAWMRPGVESPKETDLRLLIVRDGIDEPEINVKTYDEHDRFIGRPDLRFVRARVTVEYDGDHHRTNRWTYRDDKRRREAFSAAGWYAIHVSDDDLTTYAAEFLARLHAALARRTPSASGEVA